MTSRWTGVIPMLGLCAALLVGAGDVSAQQGSSGASPVVWGGTHVSLEMTAAGATLEFDCAHGAILQPIKANARGEFRVRGTFTPEHGGPIQRNNPPRDLPATYKGKIDGDVMQLEIVLDDKSQAPEPFTMKRGESARLMKCR